MTGNNGLHAFMYPSASPCRLNPPRSKHRGIASVLQGNVYHMTCVFSVCGQQPLAYQEEAHGYFLVLSTYMYCFFFCFAGDIVPAYMHHRIKGSIEK